MTTNATPAHTTGTGPTGKAAAMSGRQRVALTVLLTASFTLAVDFSILNVALPSIGADVGFAIQNLRPAVTYRVELGSGAVTFQFSVPGDTTGLVDLKTITLKPVK